MAQLKDSIVSGNLRVTDTILADILQADSIKGGIVATGTTWNGNTIDEIYGGTGQNTYAKGDLLYASAANTLSKLDANTGTKQFLSMTSSVPSWASIASTDLPAMYIGTTKVQFSSAAQALTGITTLTTSGNATIGGTVTVGKGGLIGSSNASQIYLSNSFGAVFVVDGKVIRRNTDITDITLGSSTYRWGGLYSTTGSFSSTLGVTGNTTLGGTLSVTGLSTLSGGITLGGTYNSADSKLVWDASHNAWHLIGNFYADGFVSAGGWNDSSGTSGIDEDGMWLALSKSTTDKIHISHMPYVAGSASDLTTGTSTNGTIWAAKTIADYVQSQVNTSVTSALYFRGESSTAITNNGTETATINGSSLTAKTGDLVLYNGKEFAWDGTKWIQLGDESSWASKTTKIEGTGYLSGGGTLESNRTIDIGTTYKTRIDNGNTAYGYFSNNILPVSHGGTGKSTWTQYGIVYASASGTLAQIALPTWAASTTYWLKAVTNSSKVPTYSLATLSKSDVGLGNVENTALSTWAGTNKITTVGTVTTGTWNATAISAKYGGTGMSGDNAFTGAYRIVYTSSATAMTTLAPNTTSTKKFLTMTGTGSAGQAPAWGTIAQSDVLGSSDIGDSKKFVYYDATNGLVATTQTLGSATKPLYLSSGTLTEGSTYAGGTAITLNGTSKASSTASFYAPTASGTVSEVLLSGGANASPTWAKQSSLSTGFHPKALTSKGTTATTTAGETYGVAGDSTSGKRIFTKWFVNLDNGETDLIDGMIITFRMPTAGLGTVGECITIDGNEQHFHQVVYNTNTLLTTHFAVNSVITVQYDSTISSNSYGKYNSSTGTYVHNGNTTTAIKGVWRVISLYDSGNTDVRYHQTIYYPLRTVATGGAIRRYTLCMMTMDGKMTSLRTSAEDTTNSTTLANTTYNSTTKTMFSGYLNPRKIYYWNHTDNYAAGSNITRNNTMLTHDGELIDYRYTLNCSTTLIARSNLYIVGTIDNNGFKLDPTTPWSCTLPSTEDGKVYIYVGMVHTDTAGYRGTLEENNTAYWYKDGAVRVYNYYSIASERLTTVSKTAWGQTYWTANGVPDNISGNMSNVGSIAMTGGISGATTGSFSSNVTVGGTLSVTENTTLSSKVFLGTSASYKNYDSTNGSYLVWDDANKAWHLLGNFYADGFVSAGGLGSGSGASGIDWDALATNDATHKIHYSHLPLSVSDGTTETGKYVSGISYSGGVFTVSKASLPSAYSLPVATSDALGGIKIGYTTSGKNYAVVLDVNNKAYVNVPWSNTDTWRGIYTGGTSRIGTGTGTKAINFVAGSNVTISYEAAGTGSGQSGNANYFNVKIAATDTTYSSQAAASGGTAVSLVTTGEKYNWNTAYGWGNHASEGYVKSSGVTSITLTSGTGITVSSSGTAITGTGTRTISLNVEGAKTALGLGSMAYASTSSYQPAGSYVKYSTTPPANANITDGTNPTIYLLHKDQSTTANTPTSYGLLADFTVSSGHLQFASGLTQNEIKVRSYWWTTRPSTSDPFPGYPSWVTLLHSGNYSSYALPLSGGTMSGAIKLPANVGLDNSANNVGVLFHDGTNTIVGMAYSGSVYIRTSNTNIAHRKYTSGSAYTDYTVYDSGNLSPVTTNTAQNITGQKVFYTNSNTQPVIFARSLDVYESLQIGVDDQYAYINHQNDETNSNYMFRGSWSDTETGGGASAGSGYIAFLMGSGGVSVDINGNTAYHTGNLSLATLTGSSAIGSASLPVYYTGSALAPISSLSLTGAISTNYAATNSNASLRIPISGGNAYGWGIDITNTQLSTGSVYVPLIIGVNNAAYDAMSMLFHYVEHNSTSNYYGFGFYSHDDYLTIRGDGQIKATGYIETHEFNTNRFYSKLSGSDLSIFNNSSIYNGGWNATINAGKDGTVQGTIAGAYFTNGTLGYYWYGGASHNSPAITVLPNGFVGIGTISPNTSYRLHVNGGAIFADKTVISAPGNTDGSLTICSSLGNGNAGHILFYSSSTQNGFKIASEFSQWASRQDLVFYRSNNTTSPYTFTPQEILRLTCGGNVNITGSLNLSGSSTILQSTLTVSGLTTISNHLICGVSAASASGTWSDGLDVWTYNTNSIAWAANFKNMYNNSTTNPYGVGIKLSTSSGSETSKYWGIATVNVSGWGNDLKLSFYYSSTEKAKIDASGNFSAVGNVAAGTASDERLKTNIQTLSIDSAKDIILKARPVNFTWKDIATEFYDGYKGDDIGLIAQEVEDLLPQAIGTIYEKYKRLDYTKFIPPIITVIQDHEKRIKELEDIIAKLTEENKHLKEQI